jgi:uroporphyrinogen-III synthase
MANGSVPPSFQGLRVLALESRRSAECAALVRTFGGLPVVAPALREIPLASNTEALEFAAALQRGEFDVVIFLTGVGTRALVSIVEGAYPREAVVSALGRTKVVARGPKPLAVLRELRVPVWLTIPEPNTWRQLLAALDDRADELSLRGASIAVQEYGVSNVELLDELRSRGARVTRVPVYQWALPLDLEPLRQAVTAIAAAQLDVVAFTTGVQVAHLWQIVEEMNLGPDVRRGLARMVIGSIGPSTSEALRRQGLAVDIEASHPKLGWLVRELAEQAPDLLRQKRAINRFETPDTLE